MFPMMPFAAIADIPGSLRSSPDCHPFMSLPASPALQHSRNVWRNGRSERTPDPIRIWTICDFELQRWPSLDHKACVDNRLWNPDVMGTTDRWSQGRFRAYTGAGVRKTLTDPAILRIQVTSADARAGNPRSTVSSTQILSPWFPGRSSVMCAQLILK